MSVYTLFANVPFIYRTGGITALICIFNCLAMPFYRTLGINGFIFILSNAKIIQNSPSLAGKAAFLLATLSKKKVMGRYLRA